MLPVSLRTWLTHLLFGRPGRRFQSWPGRRPSDRSTWARRAWWVGTSSLSLAIWPKIATRWLPICSPTDARPVCDETVALLMWSIKRIPEVCRWHLIWKASRVLRSITMKTSILLYHSLTLHNSNLASCACLIIRGDSNMQICMNMYTRILGTNSQTILRQS